MTQPEPKKLNPREITARAFVLIPLWQHCSLAICQDSTGMVRDYYVVEWNRWGVEDCARKVSGYYADQLYLRAYPDEKIPAPSSIPNSMTASGSIG